MPEARRPARFVLVPERPVVLLFTPLDEAAHLETPRLRDVTGEAELAVRNADLRRPSVGVDARGRFPDRVPRVVAAGIADADAVGPRARGIHLEEGAAEVVV